MKVVWILLGIFSLALLIFFIVRMPNQSTVQFENGPTIVVEIADDATEQARGLSGHAPLDDEHGMLFVWPSREVRSFWMKEMTFAIDIIWIADGKVIGIESNIEPPIDDDDILKTYLPPAPVNMVLEVAAGWADQRGIRVGDRLTVSE